MANAEDISFPARDGYPLAGVITHAVGTARAGMIVTAGTAFPQTFYQSFASHAADHGFTVLTFDARGIGDSAPDDLATFDMHYTDWGWHDTPAALDRLEAAVPGLPLFHVGHSVGGHFLGLWDNHEKVRAHAFVCVGSGFWGDHKFPSKLIELCFWHILGPQMLRRHGFVPTGYGWRGKPLPRGVFDPWKQWCLQPRYFLDEINTNARFHGHQFGEIAAPITSFIYTDDPIATPTTATVMLDLYPQAETRIYVRKPSDYGQKSIGHNGPFSSRHKTAQREIIDALCVSL